MGLIYKFMHILQDKCSSCYQLSGQPTQDKGQTSSLSMESFYYQFCLYSNNYVINWSIESYLVHFPEDQ